jgi:hypothetical protein
VGIRHNPAAASSWRSKSHIGKDAQRDLPFGDDLVAHGALRIRATGTGGASKRPPHSQQKPSTEAMPITHKIENLHREVVEALQHGPGQHRSQAG